MSNVFDRFVICPDGLVIVNRGAPRFYVTDDCLDLDTYRAWVRKIQEKLAAKEHGPVRSECRSPVERLKKLGWDLRSNRVVTELHIAEYFRTNPDLASWVLEQAEILAKKYPYLAVKTADTRIHYVLLGGHWIEQIGTVESFADWVENENQVDPDGAPLRLSDILNRYVKI